MKTKKSVKLVRRSLGEGGIRVTCPEPACGELVEPVEVSKESVVNFEYN